MENKKAIILNQKTFTKNTSLIMINHKGKQVKITLDVKIEEYDKDGVTNTLEDILNNYQCIHQELNYDAVEDPNTQKLDDISSMMPKIARLLQDIYMKELDYANKSAIKVSYAKVVIQTWLRWYLN